MNAESVELAAFTNATGSALVALHHCDPFDKDAQCADVLFCPTDSSCEHRRFRLPEGLARELGAAGARRSLFEAGRHWANRRAWKLSQSVPELIPRLEDGTLKRFEESADRKASPEFSTWLSPLLVAAPAMIDILTRSEIPLLRQHSRYIMNVLKSWAPPSEDVAT